MVTVADVAVMLPSGEAVALEQTIYMEERIADLRQRVSAALATPSCALLCEAQMLTDDMLVSDLFNGGSDAVQIAAFVDTSWEELMKKTLLVNDLYDLVGIANSEGQMYTVVSADDKPWVCLLQGEPYEAKATLDDGTEQRVMVDEADVLVKTCRDGAPPACGLRFGGDKFTVVQRPLFELCGRSCAAVLAVALRTTGATGMARGKKAAQIIDTGSNFLVGMTAETHIPRGDTMVALCAFAEHMIRSGL